MVEWWKTDLVSGCVESRMFTFDHIGTLQTGPISNFQIFPTSDKKAVWKIELPACQKLWCYNPIFPIRPNNLIPLVWVSANTASGSFLGFLQIKSAYFTVRNSLQSFFLWEVTWGTKQEALKTVLAAHQQCGWHPKHLKRSAAAPGRCFTLTYQNAVVTSYCRLRLLCTFVINLTLTQYTPTHSVVTNP